MVAMPHRTTRPDNCKIYCLLRTWSRASLSAIAERVFAATDAEAIRHGWQIGATNGGFGRRYRDPRFDTLSACPDCHGCGGTDGLGAGVSSDRCAGCCGTGRVVTKPAVGPLPDPPSGSAT